MKKTKLKFTAAVAALAMTFALAVTTGCSDGGDGTTTEDTTTTTPGSGNGGNETTDPEDQTDPTTPETNEPVEEVGSTEEALPTELEFGKSYTGYIEYTYGEKQSGNGWQNVSTGDVYLKLPKAALVADGTVKVTYSISGISDIASSVTTQGVFDNWAWADSVYTVADGTSITKKWTITSEGLEKIEDDYARFKIVVQYGGEDCADYTGKEFKLTVSDLIVTYTAPVAAGATVTDSIFEGEFTPYSTTWKTEDLQTYLDNASGDVTIKFYCALAADDDNVYDYVAQLAGWDSVWKDSTDSFDDYTFKLNGKVDGKEGDEFTVEFDVATMLSALPNTAIFTVNIYNNKITISKIEVSYQKK